MAANNDLESKTTHFTGFYTHTISGPKIPQLPIVSTYVVLFWGTSGMERHQSIIHYITCVSIDPFKVISCIICNLFFHTNPVAKEK